MSLSAYGKNPVANNIITTHCGHCSRSYAYHNNLPDKQKMFILTFHDKSGVYELKLIFF